MRVLQVPRACRRAVLPTVGCTQNLLDTAARMDLPCPPIGSKGISHAAKTSTRSPGSRGGGKGWAAVAESLGVAMQTEVRRGIQRDDVDAVMTSVRREAERCRRGGTDMCARTSEEVVSYLTRKRLWAQVEEVMKMPEFPLHKRLCDDIQTAFSSPSHWKEGMAVISMMRARGLEPGPIMYRVMIEQVTKAGRLKEARALLRLERDGGSGAKRHRRRVPWPLVSMVLEKHAERGLVEECLGMFEEARARHECDDDPWAFNQVLKACARGKHGQRAMKLLESELRREKAAVDVVSFNTVISACAKEMRADLGEAVLQLMQSQGVKPDYYTYNALLNAYAGAGDLEGARSTLQRMRDAGLTLTIHCYSIMVKALTRAGDIDGALACMNDLRLAGLQPNEIVYSTVIHACGHVGRVDEARMLFQQAVKAGKCNDAVHATLMDVYAKQGMMKEAVSLLREMEAGGIRPTVTCFNMAMAACNRIERYDRSLQLFAELQEAGLDVNVHTCHLFLEAAFLTGKPEMALQLVYDVAKSGRASVGGATWATTLSLCGKTNRVDLAEAVFKWLRKTRRVYELQQVRELLMVIMANGSRLGLALRAHQIAPGLDKLGRPSPAALTSIIKCCSREGLWPVALYLYDEMCWRGQEDKTMVGAVLRTLDQSCPVAFELLSSDIFRAALLKRNYYPKFTSYFRDYREVDLHDMIGAEAKAAMRFFLGLDGGKDPPATLLHGDDEDGFFVLVGASKRRPEAGSEKEQRQDNVLKTQVFTLLEGNSEWIVTRVPDNAGRLRITRARRQEEPAALSSAQ